MRRLSRMRSTACSMYLCCELRTVIYFSRCVLNRTTRPVFAAHWLEADRERNFFLGDSSSLVSRRQRACESRTITKGRSRCICDDVAIRAQGAFEPCRKTVRAKRKCANCGRIFTHINGYHTMQNIMLLRCIGYRGPWSCCLQGRAPDVFPQRPLRHASGVELPTFRRSGHLGQHLAARALHRAAWSTIDLYKTVINDIIPSFLYM